ncbi:MAG: hypothetical protein PHV39_01370 [Methanomicrobium sp.]|jgi:hypothetical protein|nr:hypothetical protein [Methanomicrobium sp.]
MEEKKGIAIPDDSPKGELPQQATVRKYLTVQNEGEREVSHQTIQWSCC